MESEFTYLCNLSTREMEYLDRLTIAKARVFAWSYFQFESVKLFKRKPPKYLQSTTKDFTKTASISIYKS